MSSLRHSRFGQSGLLLKATFSPKMDTKYWKPTMNDIYHRHTYFHVRGKDDQFHSCRRLCSHMPGDTYTQAVHSHQCPEACRASRAS